jgi:hypothetical protein
LSNLLYVLRETSVAGWHFVASNVESLQNLRFGRPSATSGTTGSGRMECTNLMRSQWVGDSAVNDVTLSCWDGRVQNARLSLSTDDIAVFSPYYELGAASCVAFLVSDKTSKTSTYTDHWYPLKVSDPSIFKRQVPLYDVRLSKQKSRYSCLFLCRPPAPFL